MVYVYSVPDSVQIESTAVLRGSSFKRMVSTAVRTPRGAGEWAVKRVAKKKCGNLSAWLNFNGNSRGFPN